MKLFFIDGQKKGDSFELSPPGASIGRELDNDIILEGEGESRYHAKLEFDGKDWKIKDLGSTNGTKHNGIKITPDEFAFLKESDTIVIGKQTMLFAEKLPEKPEGVIISAKNNKQEEKREEESPAPSIVAIKPPSPADETITDHEPEKKDIDDKSSKSFSDFFSDNEKEGKDSSSQFTESTDFFGKTKQNINEMKKDDKKKHAGILFYVAVIAVALILVGIFILGEIIKPEPTATNKTLVKKKTGAPLLIRYEKQVTTTKPKINIFRYLMEIKNGKVTITKDDVQSKYKAKLARTVGEEQLNDLEDKIRETDFMETPQPQIGIANDNEDRLQILTIAYGKDMNTIKVKNTPPPRSFIETITELENFSRDVLKIPPVSLTPEEMKKNGLDAYRKAKMLFDNYQAKEENLKIAIQFFNIAIENLQGFKHLEEYDLAYKYKNDAIGILEEEIKQHFANARILYNNKQYSQMRDQLLSIMAKIEPGSNNYKKAKTALINVERQIKNKRK